MGEGWGGLAKTHGRRRGGGGRQREEDRTNAFLLSPFSPKELCQIVHRPSEQEEKEEEEEGRAAGPFPSHKRRMQKSGEGGGPRVLTNERFERPKLLLLLL